MTTTVLRNAGYADRRGGVSARSGTVRGSAPLRDWGGFALVLVGRVYRALVFTLLAIAVLPAAGSWSSYLVRTASMEPSIAAGDVVLGRPFLAEEKVPVGRVMIFEAPPGSRAGSSLLVHRLVERLADGTFTTAGDANATPDAAPLRREDIRSRAMIRVPYIGLPLVWWQDGQHLRLLLWLVTTVLLIQLSFRRVDGDPPRASTWWHRSGGRLRAALRLPRARHRQPVTVGLRTVLAVGSLGLAIAVPSAADAAFTARTSNGSSTWRTGAALIQPYTSAVMADSPFAFYRLDESSGSNATDSSGNDRTGSYTNVADYRQEGALPNNAGFAVRFAGSGGRMVGGGNATSAPLTFSTELWVRTTTNAGGRLIGFENSRNQNANTSDRVLILRTDGRLAFLAGSGAGATSLTSPTAVNDGTWHHLVVTERPLNGLADTRMYVDGALVASGSLTNPASYSGWWRIGYGKVPSRTGFPSTGNFTGSIDDVAVYTKVLTATRVTTHYEAR